MMAKRISTILPDMTFDESLEVTKIYSIVGQLGEKINGIFRNRPFRSPHHSISEIGLVGGGRIPRPGEISLAHNGVLFLDELPEFNRSTLEVLRGPLEDKKITIGRAYGTFTYPSNFMLVASMNPCPCGYYGSKEKECNCTENQIKKYRAKISGPLLDRIDIQINVPNVKFNDFEVNKTERSSEIRSRVNKARMRQLDRYKNLKINDGYKIYSNSELTHKFIERYCVLDRTSKGLLNRYFDKLKLSARAYNRILKVTRTIADLDEVEEINSNHLLEAIQLSRCFDNEKIKM